MGKGVSALVLAAVVLLPSAAFSEEKWSLQDGSMRMHFFSEALEQLRLSVETQSSDSERGPLSSAELLLDNRRPVQITTFGTRTGEVSSSKIYAADGLTLRRGSAAILVREFAVISGEEQSQDDSPVLLLSGLRASVNQESERAAAPADAVLISRGLAAKLGQPLLEGTVIGRAVMNGRPEWTGGDEPVALERAAPIQPHAAPGATAVAPQPDVKFCELYGLQQFGRSGDVAGLAITTTSWNVGARDLRWFGAPGEQHPFIVQNAYRLKDGRFEQIGQSWIKHGFFALDDEQCATNCTYEPGHGQGDWLGVGCTDTYTAGLNATQSGLGPRQEVNPWAGTWEYTGSHIQVGGGGHNGISHRLQIHDADLNPAQNAGATYFVEGYYVHLDDIDVMNSAAWKTFTVTSGSPGGTWGFGMSAFNVRPTDGFAIDAWTGATQTKLAEELPVTENVSPDGRCILSSKATDLGGGEWHYEYALLNIDMHRKVKSFSIPLDVRANVQNIGFHAPDSHNESYDNVPWTSEISTDCPTSDRCITWTTVNNPIRWGTVYNFRFDADMPPQESQVAGGETANAMVTIGLFEPGSPATISGMTVGPMLGVPIPAASAWTLSALGLLILIAGTVGMGRWKAGVAPLA